MNTHNSGCILNVVLHDDALEPLTAAAKKQIVTDEMGALVTFDGIVRNHDNGHVVESLTYTAHPDAQKFMAEVVQFVADDFPDVRLWVAHRTGKLAIGELAFCVLAASAHRENAFRACSRIADRVKAEVPIWKEQVLVDGRSTWVGLDENITS